MTYEYELKLLIAALSEIAVHLERIANTLDAVTGRTDSGRRFIRTWDCGKD